MPSERLAGAVLAGGRSTRMGGGSKALLPLAGKAMIQHVIGRLQPQLSRPKAELWLSVEQESDELRPFGLLQIEDPRPGSHGPLGGLLACLRQLDDPDGWLLLAPCDAPLIPLDLGQRLLAHALLQRAPGCVIRYAGEVQPTFSVWRGSLLREVEQAYEACGLGGFKAFLRKQPLPYLDWPLSLVSPFLNINDQEALDELERLLGALTEDTRHA